MSSTPTSLLLGTPWCQLIPQSAEHLQTTKQVRNYAHSRRVVRARDPSVNGSFDEPVRKGRKPEVSKQHPAVLRCRELVLSGIPLHRVAIEAGVEYTMLARWYDKGWMNAPKKVGRAGQ